MESPATSREEVPVPRETLIKVGWCNIPLYLVGSAQLVSGCLYERSSNCVAQIGASNTAGQLSDGYTVQVLSVND